MKTGWRWKFLLAAVILLLNARSCPMSADCESCVNAGCSWCAGLGLCADVDEVINGCEDNCEMPLNVTVRIRIRFSVPMQYDPEKDCMGIFHPYTSSIFGDQAVCQWRSANQIRVFLLSTSIAKVNDTVVINPGFLTPFGASNSLPYPILAPLSVNYDLLDSVSIQIQLPAVMNLCSAGTAVAQAIGYNDPRPLIYAWTATSNSADISVFSSKLALVTSSTLLMTKSDLLPGYQYTVTARAISPIFGPIGNGTAKVERTAQLIPTVSIDGAPVILPPLLKDLFLHATVDGSSCTAIRNPPAYRFSWSVYPAISLDWSTKQSSTLFVSANSLELGVDYVFTLRLARPSGEYLAQDSITVRPKLVAPVASISGGDRTMDLKSVFSVNGIGSYDPILGSTQQYGLSYNWTIFRAPACASPALFADDFDLITVPNSDPKYLTINSTALGEGTWTVCLSVARAQQASAPSVAEYYRPSLPDCVTIFISATAPTDMDVGVDLDTAIIDGVLYPPTNAYVTARSVVAVNAAGTSLAPIEVAWTLVGQGVVGALASLSPMKSRQPAATPYLFSFSPSALPPMTFVTLQLTLSYPLTDPVVVTRKFWTPPTPSSPWAPCTVSTNPVASFPQRYTLICADWSSASSTRFLPLSYTVGLPTFPILDSYSPLINFYVPRPFIPTDVTLVYTVTDWRNLTTGANVVLSTQPESGTYLDLLQFLSAAADARDVAILPPLAYQALTSVSFALTNKTVPFAEGRLATETVVNGMHDAIAYFPITAITVAQSAAILQLAFDILPDPTSRSGMSSSALSIVSFLCQSLPLDTTSDTRYELVNVIESLYEQLSLSSTLDLPTLDSASFTSLFTCVSAALSPLTMLDQPPVTISSDSITYFSQSVRRGDISGLKIGGDSNWPSFSLPIGFDSEPSLAAYDALRVVYTAALANSFTSDKFVAPVCSLSIQDLQGKEVPVLGLTNGISVMFQHTETAPRNSDGEPEPVYCIYWDVAHSSWETDGCTPVATSDNLTECLCTHLTSFAISYNQSFAPERTRHFPVVIVACTVGGGLLLLVLAVVGALLYSRSRHAKKSKEEEGKKHNEVAMDREPSVDLARLRSEINISAVPPKLMTSTDAELRQAVHEQMALAGLVPPAATPTPPFAPSALLVSVERVPSLNLSRPVAPMSSSTGPSTSKSSGAASGTSATTGTAPLEASAKGGLRFWNKEMAYQGSDQVSGASES